MNIKLTKEIGRDVLENIFVTALEGGSNYWYFLSDEARDIIRKYVPKSEDPYLSTAILKALEKGAVIPINDAENEDEVLGELSMDIIATRLQKLHDDMNFSSALDLEMQGNGDVNSSDVIFQFLTMGEYVFS